MQCNTEWTGQFLKQHFSDAFIKGDLRKHTSTIMLQQQVAMLPATQPAVEQQIIYEQHANEIDPVDKEFAQDLSDVAAIADFFQQQGVVEMTLEVNW